MLYADDDKLSIASLLRLRVPSIFIGLFLGVALSFATSNFEEVLQHNVQVAFFIPFVVYMSAAVGAQTQNIYSRDLKSGRAGFKHYLVKETIIGILLGIGVSVITAVFTYAWLRSYHVSFAVSLSMLIAISIAPLIGLMVTEIFQLEHRDPAVGSGPIGTVIQDTLSIMIYGFVASAILL